MSIAAVDIVQGDMVHLVVLVQVMMMIMATIQIDQWAWTIIWASAAEIIEELETSSQ